jgi:hypothetical protein
MSEVRNLIPDNSEVAHLMNVLVKELRGNVIEELVGVKGAAKYLLVTPKTIHVWIRSGVLPKKVVHYKGSRPYFLLSELRDEIKRS